MDQETLKGIFEDEQLAREWFESIYWPDGRRRCGHCGSDETKDVPNAKPMPYWCRPGRHYFSVKTGTPLQRSQIPLRVWAQAIYLELTSPMKVTQKQLSRVAGVSMKSAWSMLFRVRFGLNGDGRLDDMRASLLS